MRLLEVVREVRRHLEENGRVSYRMLRREFELDDEALEELIDELVETQGVATRGSSSLEWAGGRATATATASSSQTPREYTPKHLADKILRSKSALEGERKQVTVLFADIKGSQELAEQVDAEEWHAILDRFFGILTASIHRFEGTINQYTGDGVMALFGAPIAHEDHAQRGCYTALHLREQLGRYADELRDSLGLELSVRMGLNSGEVVVGKIGDDLRMDYTAQGATVGLAQRMEQIAQPGQVCLAEDTARLVGDFFALRDLGSVAVKGSRDPVRAHALEGAGRLSTRLEAARDHGFSKFVGRAEEMDALETALGDALDGPGRAVAIVAEAGTGKSRLCFEFAERCRERGISVFEAHGRSHGRQLPMLPILDLLRSFFGVEEADSDEAARERIAARLAELDESLDPELPLLFDLMGVPDPARSLDTVDPEAHLQRILGAVERIALADRGPTVILVEDLHWLDGSSDRLLDQIVTAVRASNGLVIANFRPEYSAQWTRDPRCVQLELGPLGPEATRELLTDLLGDDPTVAGLAEMIEARTGGNPFFVEEVVQMLAETGALRGSRGARTLAHPIEEIAVPLSVQTVLAARIDRLGEREKRVLQTAAVVGERVPLPVLRRVAGRPDSDLDAALANLARAGFLVEVHAQPHVEYAFKHPLTEAVGYDSQLRERRASIHAEAALAFEELDPEKLDERAALLAYHWEAAGHALRAAGWHRRAAEWIGLAAPPQALRHWRRVRELARGEGSRAAAELVALATYQTLNLGWRLGLSERELRAAVSECRVSAAQFGDAALIVRVLCAYAVCQNFRGSVGENVKTLTEALESAREAGSPDMEIDVLVALQDSLWILGRLQEACALCTRVIELTAEDVSHVSFAGTSSYLESLARRAVIAAELGQHKDALDDVELALRLAEASSVDENKVHALVAAIRVGELTGRAGANTARARRLSGIAEKTGSPLWTLSACLCGGIAHSSGGQWSEAIDLLERVVDRIDRRALSAHDHAHALTFLAQAYAGAGRASEARATAERAVEACKASDMQAAECRAHIALARGRLGESGAGARRRVQSALRRAEKLAEQTGAALYRPFIREVRAELLQALDDPEAATRTLREAQRQLEEMGASEHAARVAALASALDS